MFKLAALGLAVAATFAVAVLAAAPPSAKPGPLEGKYTIVAGEHGGKPLPADHFKGSVVRITGDTMIGTDKDRKELFASSYTLDTGTRPWTVRMRTKIPKDGPEAVGLVKRDGDTVTIIYALPGGDPPKEFKTKEKQNLFVLKPADMPSAGNQAE